ncbi:MAG: CHAT domain-containing protein [Acidobacteria bacterium]|nr:CHAT domain-containing protein [Acidobacteriota bacterium]
MRETGEYSEAREVLERALRIEERAYGDRHSYIASTVFNLAQLLGLMGDIAEARRAYERSRAIWERLVGPDTPEVASCLNELGELSESVHDYGEARQIYNHALAIREAKLPPEHDDIAQTLTGLARVEAATGNGAGARALGERALGIRQASLGPDHPDVAATLNDLAGFLADAGEEARARSLYETALGIREKVLGPTSPLVGKTLGDMGDLLARDGQLTPALDAALRAEEISRDHLRLTSRTLAERQALGYASVRVSGLHLAEWIALESGKELPEAGRRAFDAVIRSRALVLDEMAARNRVPKTSGDPEIAALAGEVASSRARLAHITIGGPDSRHPEAFRERIDRSRRDVEHAERALAERSLTFRQKMAADRAGLREVAASLPRSTALVAFVLYRPPAWFARTAPAAGTPPHGLQYAAFVLRAGEEAPTLVPMGPAAEIDDLVAAWRKEASQEAIRPGLTSSDLEERYRAAASALRERTWDRLAPALARAKRVFVVPEGALNLVNFAALPSGDATYLVETGPDIHYLSSERDLVPQAGRSPAGTGILAVGGPAFDDASTFARLGKGAAIVRASVSPQAAGGDPSPEPDGHHRRRTRPVKCSDLSSIVFESLPESAREAEAVAAIYSSRSEGRTILLGGAGATESAVKKLAPGRRILHLATHGFFLEGPCSPSPDAARGGDNPLLLSGLALAGANHRDAASPDEDDGILTAEEIAGSDLSGVEWAVLSACDTGSGRAEAGEGVFGLRRAFEVAGARTLIMSLWPIDDEAARRWMEALYEARFVRRLDTVRSVRRASLETLRLYRKQNHTSHPFYWAAFVAAGDWH